MPQLAFRREGSSYVFYIEPVATGDDEICADQIPSNARWYVGHSAGSSTSVTQTDVTGHVVDGRPTGLVLDDDLQFALPFVSAGRYVSYLQVGDVQGNLYTLTLNPRHEFPINDGVWEEQTLSISPGQDTVQVSSRLDCEEDLSTDSQWSTLEELPRTGELSTDSQWSSLEELPRVQVGLPTATIDISRATAYTGQSYSVSWSSSGATSVEVRWRLVSGIWVAHSTNSSGSVFYTVAPDWALGEREWEIRATNSVGSSADSASIDIIAAPVTSTDSAWSRLEELPRFVSDCSIEASNTSPSANATVTITATWENSNGAVTVFDDNNAVLHTSTSATGTWSNNYAESGGTQRIFNINCDGQGTIGRPVDDSVTVNWQRRTQPEDFNLICDPIPEITIARQPVPNYVGDYEDLGDFPPGQIGTPYDFSIGDVTLYAKRLWEALVNSPVRTPVGGEDTEWENVTSDILALSEVSLASYDLSPYFDADDSLVDTSEIRIFDAPDDDGNDVTFTVRPPIAIAFARAATASVLALEVGQTNIAFRISHSDTVSRANCNFNVTITDDTVDSDWSSLTELPREGATDSPWSVLEELPRQGVTTDSDWSSLRELPRAGVTTDSDWSTLRELPRAGVPIVSISVSDDMLIVGTRTVVSWSSTDADSVEVRSHNINNLGGPGALISTDHNGTMNWGLTTSPGTLEFSIEATNSSGTSRATVRATWTGPTTDSPWSSLEELPRAGVTTDSEWSSLEEFRRQAVPGVNSRPECDPLPDVELDLGENETLDITAYLYDPDGDDITIHLTRPTVTSPSVTVSVSDSSPDVGDNVTVSWSITGGYLTADAVTDPFGGSSLSGSRISVAIHSW